MEKNKNEVLIYEDENNIRVEVFYEDENVWLTQTQIAELFKKSVSTINEHIKNIYRDKELIELDTMKKFGISEFAKKPTNYYNLDMIISVGYRVNSKIGIAFRRWATEVVKSYLIKGFAMDDERLKNPPKFGKDYFKELLTRIKDIRTSEYRMYKQILDIFEVTSTDYNSKSEEAYTFFKIVQNKLHFAITGKTAAELIFERADSYKENMGLTNWKSAPDGKLYKYDVSIAKNYLNEKELEKLRDLTNIFLDIAEMETKEQKIFTMHDWINITDDLLRYRKKEILLGSGKVSNKVAIEKAHKEYEIFKVRQDEQYISGMDILYEKYLKEEDN